jgi:hypothetical protein
MRGWWGVEKGCSSDYVSSDAQLCAAMLRSTLLCYVCNARCKRLAAQGLRGAGGALRM